MVSETQTRGTDTQGKLKLYDNDCPQFTVFNMWGLVGWTPAADLVGGIHRWRRPDHRGHDRSRGQGGGVKGRRMRQTPSLRAEVGRLFLPTRGLGHVVPHHFWRGRDHIIPLISHSPICPGWSPIPIEGNPQGGSGLQVVPAL